MDLNRKIEMTRRILNNAVSMNMSKEIILKISKKLDRLIVEFYQQENLNKKIEKTISLFYLVLCGSI